MPNNRFLLATIACLSFVSLAFSQEAPLGSIADMSKDERQALDGIKGHIPGKIVWSTSRAHSKHDIWIMNADGTDQKALTSSPDNVDWFSRFSPDGKSVLFCRSKSGWVAENDAEMYEKWDLWTIGADGAGEKKVASDAVWGTWRPAGDSIVFARGSKVFIKHLGDTAEKEIFDAEPNFKKGTFAQQPELSPNGKCLAVTLRGSTRKTGIWNFDKKEWYETGGGCEMSWFPSGDRVYRMNEGQGNGGTEVLQIALDGDGKPLHKVAGLSIPKEMHFMDLPGRRSHEYFPSIDPTGQWLVWGASRGEHEHDIADYEIYIWKIGTDAKNAVRMTFHTANDRWPDLFPGTVIPAPAGKSTMPDTTKR